MKRVNQIVTNPLYQEYIRKTAGWEKDREFCRHDAAHFLDVARIALLLNERENYGIDQEIIYAAALLHDIGRWQQYENGEDHAAVSARLAPAILEQCGFSLEEEEQILSSIRTHRESRIKDEKSLNGLLYRADKLSRPCYFCEQERNCNWKQDKKNMKIII